jgi:hypothetical protein
MITSGLRQMWRTLVSKGELSGHRGGHRVSKDALLAGVRGGWLDGLPGTSPRAVWPPGEIAGPVARSTLSFGRLLETGRGLGDVAGMPQGDSVLTLL